MERSRSLLQTIQRSNYLNLCINYSRGLLATSTASIFVPEDMEK